MTGKRIIKLKRKLQESRHRLIFMHGEFAESLEDMIFVATKDVRRISTNGRCIYFNPDWLQKLENKSLDFILAHQLMHIKLGHIDRYKYFQGDRYHISVDIVANSNLSAMGWNYEKMQGLGKIYYTTFYPGTEGMLLTVEQAMKEVPFDPAVMKPEIRRTYMVDSEEWWNEKNDRGENGIIILSPKDEDIYDLEIEDTRGGVRTRNRKIIIGEGSCKGTGEKNSYDERDDANDKNFTTILAQLRSIKAKAEQAAGGDNFTQRVWQNVNDAGIDWRKLLNTFIRTEVCDYSFTPPDRRFCECEFFLPDYNVDNENPRRILFMIDTSGSIQNDVLAAVYAEMLAAIQQFNGALSGLIGTFDVNVYGPVEFNAAEDVKRLIPVGGGGTDYRCIFNYVRNNMSYNLPVCIVIFTDGEGEFPKETEADNIPVLWLFSKEIAGIPWGKAAFL